MAAGGWLGADAATVVTGNTWPVAGGLVATKKDTAPCAAMQSNQRGIWACPLWRVIVPCQDVAIMHAKLDVVLDVYIVYFRHVAPRFKGRTFLANGHVGAKRHG